MRLPKRRVPALRVVIVVLAAAVRVAALGKKRVPAPCLVKAKLVAEAAKAPKAVKDPAPPADTPPADDTPPTDDATGIGARDAVLAG